MSFWRRRRLEKFFQEALDAGNNERASTVLAELSASVGANNEQLRFSTALLYLHQCKHPEAQATLELLCADFPNNDIYWLLQAELLFTLGDFAKAEQALQQSLRMDPHNLRSLYLQGKLCLTRGDEERAEQFFERVLIQDKTYFYTRLLTLGELRHLDSTLLKKPEGIS